MDLSWPTPRQQKCTDGAAWPSATCDVPATQRLKFTIVFRRAQPFYSTSCIEGLISEVEAALQPLSAPSAAAPGPPAAAAAASADAAAAPPADAASPHSAGGAAAGEATASTAASNPAAAADVPGSPAQKWQPVVAALAAPSVVHSPSRSRSQTDILKRTRVAMALWAVSCFHRPLLCPVSLTVCLTCGDHLWRPNRCKSLPDCGRSLPLLGV